MRDYVIRRLLALVPTVLLVASGVFALMRVIPGDIVDIELQEATRLDPQVIARRRAELGLDRPVLVQYTYFLRDLARGSLGRSLWTGEPIWRGIRRTVPVTAELAVLGIVVALCIALPVGVLSAIRPNTPLDHGGRFFSILGLSLPNFWIATMAVTFPALWWGYHAPLGFVRFWDNPWVNLQQIGPPALIEGFALSAITMRMTRSTMLEVVRQDYIRTAWAKGLRERTVIQRHAVKNALIPVITIVGIQLARLMGGAVILETVFFLPGIGLMTYTAITQRDYAVVQGNVIFLATLLVLTNLLVDMLYAVLDPRIRYMSR